MQQNVNLRARAISVCCVATIAALYVVGFVSRTELRHVVQTSPLWVGAILGHVGARMARWVPLPLFAFWLVLMSLIWLYPLGWANGREYRARLLLGSGRFLLSAGFQVAILYVSFLPKFAHR